MSDIFPQLDPRIVAHVNAYLRDNANPDLPVCRPLPPGELASRLDLSLPEAPGTLDGLYEFIERYLAYAVRTGHGQFFNQLWSGFDLPGFLGDLVASLANTSMYTYEVAPAATLMEIALVSRLGAMCGFADAEGLFTSGASAANLQAMLLARHRAEPALKRSGFWSGSVAGFSRPTRAEARTTSSTPAKKTASTSARCRCRAAGEPTP